MKLLDEKGLTTVWAAIKNTFTSKSDADGKYAKTADVNTALAKKVDAVSGKGLSTNDFTAAYKSKLDGIATGANNYTLPTASTTTLGGIKVSESADGTSWPICVDSSGLAQAKISGLVSVKGTLFGIRLKSNTNEASFGPTQISVKGGGDEELKAIKFPSKSGTFALTSDIPDVSSLCKLYTANNIERCVYGRINFMTPLGDVNLDSILHKEGIIIFANLTSASNITCSEGFVYNNDYIDNSKRVEPGMFLITISANIAVVSSL